MGSTSIEGNTKTSSKFGHRENQDYVQVNVQVNTEYEDNLNTQTETFTEVEDCNCECDCDNSDRNAAAEVTNDIDSQYFGPGSGNDDEDDRSDSGICSSFNCENPPCQIFCKAETGYYPDSRDCRNFCFCSGNRRIPSKFQ